MKKNSFSEEERYSLFWRSLLFMVLLVPTFFGHNFFTIVDGRIQPERVGVKLLTEYLILCVPRQISKQVGLRPCGCLLLVLARWHQGAVTSPA